jgi:hypothetical protein
MRRELANILRALAQRLDPPPAYRSWVINGFSNATRPTATNGSFVNAYFQPLSTDGK